MTMIFLRGDEAARDVIKQVERTRVDEKNNENSQNARAVCCLSSLFLLFVLLARPVTYI